MVGTATEANMRCHDTNAWKDNHQHVSTVIGQHRELNTSSTCIDSNRAA